MRKAVATVIFLTLTNGEWLLQSFRFACFYIVDSYNGKEICEKVFRRGRGSVVGSCYRDMFARVCVQMYQKYPVQTDKSNTHKWVRILILGPRTISTESVSETIHR